MKPIFLVIVGSAMLMPAMHQNLYSNDDDTPEKKIMRQDPHAPTKQQALDSEMLIHDLSFWIDRLP